MASAIEHWLEAEQILRNIDSGSYETDEVAAEAAVALVHAELASAGATLLADRPHSDPHRNAMLRVVSGVTE